MIQAVATHTGLKGHAQGVGDDRLKRVCAEFESIMITYMLKTMRNSVSKDGLFGESNESKIFSSMHDENLALGIARGGGLGLGKILFEHIKE